MRKLLIVWFIAILLIMFAEDLVVIASKIATEEAILGNMIGLTLVRAVLPLKIDPNSIQPVSLNRRSLI